VYNPKPAIATAFNTDASLVALMPVTSMFNGVAVFATVPVYPYLVFSEIANIPALSADDEEIESEVTVRVDIYGTATLSTIAGHVDRIIKAVGYTRNFAADNDEVATTGEKIFHKTMSYSGTFTFV